MMSKIAPHYCCGCDRIGSLLCDNCKYNIISDKETICINCRRPASISNLCGDCKVPYERAWIVGKREKVLQRLIGLYKFERAKEAHIQLADLLLATLPVLPDNLVIVPVPTTSAHIRERGYDHCCLVARRLAKIRGLKIEKLLSRKTNTKQRQASAKLRQKQAKDAFEINKKPDADKIYLLIDDVVTTGATIKYAALNLRKAGAKHVWVAAIARQALD
ncbi:ComF family protein [Candidatus Saccharibacteria bacterium]|nr:ComF family protein [Candidatus Saccharibacteria bacterium]